MKKRILSLILALSMVLSVLPLGAFAEGSTQDLVMQGGFPKDSNYGSNSCSGSGWSYETSTGTLYLNSGTYNFSSTQPVQCAIEVVGAAEITGGTFNRTVSNNYGTISDGTFESDVTNDKNINGGNFRKRCSVTNGGTITGKGTFEGSVTNGGTIENGTFNGEVTNNSTISGGTFQNGCSVTNNNTISGGNFQNGCSVINNSNISDGTFEGTVTNDTNGRISGGTFQSTGSVTNGNTIENGTFNGTVTNNTGTISGGTFNGTVYNNEQINGGIFQETCSVTNNGNGIISGGIFSSTVYNNSGNITNGTFAGSVTNEGNGMISGGTFQSTCSVTNGNGVVIGGTFEGTVINSGNGIIDNNIFNGNTGVHNITWDAASSKAKIKEVNGVSLDGSAVWKPYACAGTTVTITADTEIFSLNGQPISTGNCNSSYGSDKKTVTFTMPDKDVVLSTGELVMKNGLPDCSNGTKGNGWEYRSDTLILTSGTYDFSSTEPVQCAIQSSATITGGIFDGTVTNNAGGTISDGTFYGTVTNNTKGDITGGTFNGTVTNNGTITGNGTFLEKVTNNQGGNITNGTFNHTVENNAGGTISNGTFEQEVINNAGGEISGGTFKGTVLNGNGIITGGTFAAGLSRNDGSVTGGIFNGDTGLTDARHVTVTNGSLLKVNGVDPRNADGTTGTAWNLYTYKGTTVTITASTEIFSLNGKSIGDGNCNSSYGSGNNIVTFTMPGENVVLNGAITCTDLVMEKGRPEASKEGKISCSGTDWSYDHNTDTLTLTSNSGTYDFSLANPQDTTNKTPADSAVACAIEIQSGVEITGGTFEKKVTNNDGGTISGGTFQETCSVTNNGTIKKGTFKDACSVTNEGTNATIENGTFKNMCRVINNKTIKNGTFKNMCSVENNGTINNGTFTYKVENNGIITGGVFNGNANLTGVTGGYNITVASGAKIEKVNGVSADWAPYVVTSNATTKEVTITADTEIFSLNGKPIAESSYGVDKKTVTFTMPDDDVVLNEKINYGDLVMENGYPKASKGGTTACKGDGWEYIKNDPTNGDMLLLTGSNQTGGLYDFSTIGDGSAVECNVFVGKPTAITGGEFNGKVFNNSGILGGTFHGEVDNMGPGTIKDGTFKNSVENKGMIENGAFHDEVKNNGTINDGTFHGAVENNGTINGGVFNGAVTGSGTVSESITGNGTLNGEPITKPEPTPEPEPTTYTVTVIGGTIDGKTSVSAKENETLTVVLDQNDIPDGMTFDLWSISSSKLSGDINVDYRAEAMTFQMPAEDVTIRAQYRSAEIIEDAAPSPLATAATIAVGGAAAGIVVWQGVSLGVDLYLANALPQGVPVPTDRRALALLLWETAGKPEVALPTLYGDIPTEEIELQKATRWAVQNGLMDAADKKDASFFDPDHYVTKMDVFGAWLRLKKLLGTT